MKVVMSQARAFEDHIATGAAWEISAQNDIASALVAQRGTAAREVNYPDSGKSVDLASALDGALYLVELKVESASKAGKFSGQSLEGAFEADKKKLKGFDVDAFVTGSGLTRGRKWVVVIAYSADSKEKMKDSNLFSRLYESGKIRGGIADA